MDKCKRNACGDARNVLIGVMNMHIQLYMHDVMLLAENPNDLQRILDRQYESVKDMNLKLHQSNTKLFGLSEWTMN